MESRQRLRIMRQAGWQEFNGHDLAKLQIFRAINFPHPTAAGESDHPIAIRNDLTGREPAATDGVRAGERACRTRRCTRGAVWRMRGIEGRAAGTCWRKGLAFVGQVLIDESGVNA